MDQTELLPSWCDFGPQVTCEPSFMWGKKETIAEWSLALGRCYYHTQTNTHVVHKNTGLTKKRMSRLQSYILKMLDG